MMDILQSCITRLTNWKIPPIDSIIAHNHGGHYPIWQSLPLPRPLIMLVFVATDVAAAAVVIVDGAAATVAAAAVVAAASICHPNSMMLPILLSLLLLPSPSLLGRKIIMMLMFQPCLSA